ncbi:copper radical oxidase [Moniliophthora roreri]|nr:copper radical oxidase [Moniliophthora roreri]
MYMGDDKLDRDGVTVTRFRLLNCDHHYQHHACDSTFSVQAFLKRDEPRNFAVVELRNTHRTAPSGALRILPDIQFRAIGSCWTTSERFGLTCGELEAKEIVYRDSKSQCCRATVSVDQERLKAR